MNVTVDEIKGLIQQIGTKGYRDGSSTKPGFVYHSIPFDGFEDIRIHKNGHCAKEYDLIKKVLENKNIQPDSVLDIGSNIGFFTFNFNRDFDAEVSAVEKDSFNAEVLSAFNQHYQLTDKITVHNSDVHQFLQSNEKTFDVGLMLNVHMWVHKQHGSAATKKIMSELCGKVKHFFFQTAHAESAGMYIIKELRTVAQVQEYLKEVGFTDVEQVFKTTWHGKKNRTLFYAKGKG
jgi:SAM-dependent methyltransferase